MYVELFIVVTNLKIAVGKKSTQQIKIKLFCKNFMALKACLYLKFCLPQKVSL